MVDKYKNHVQATSFVKRIIEKKEKICFTYTSKHFTAGHTSDQRGESNNSRLKERGRNKENFKRFNLAQLVEHVQSINDRQSIQSIKEIQNLIVGGKKWSSYVDRFWKEQYTEASMFQCKQESKDANFETWVATNELEPTVHRVEVSTISQDHENYKPPKCTCRTHLSTELPCRGICSVVL
jgi:hypothetical protein